MAHFVFYDLPQDVKNKIIDLRAEMSANRFLLAAYQLQELLGKTNFNPDQARVPAGSGRESGRWTRVDGGATRGDGSTQPQLIAVVDRMRESDRRNQALSADAD